MMFRLASLLLIAYIASAQISPDSPTFEVASVKPAAPLGPGVMFGMRGGPESRDPGQFTANFANLRMLLGRAYNVRVNRISGPDWIDSERYDILARVPEGATREKFSVMLQNLLRERFKLTLHREKREQPVYALVVGKNGPKLKEAQAAQDGPASPPGPVKIGKDGLPELPCGRGALTNMMPGRVRMGGACITLTELAYALENQVGRPVVDETGLTAKYDITLDFAPDESMRGNAGRMPGAMMAPPPPPAPPPGGAPVGDVANIPPNFGEGAPSVFAAIQQLGLKLDAKKAAVDVIVVDSGDKTPTEN